MMTAFLSQGFYHFQVLFEVISQSMGNCSEAAPSVSIFQGTAPKMIGVGFNYLKEGDKAPPNPILFLKSWSSICYNPSELSLPLLEESKLIHELQLGVMMGSRAFRVKKEEAMSHVAGYFILLDITDTSKGKPGDYIPETFVKSQDNFCPVSPPIEGRVDPYEIQLELMVNNETRQKDFTKNMHFKIEEIIEYASQWIGLNEGDLILTGTPVGAGPLRLGDRVEGTARVGKEVVAALSLRIVK